MTLNEKVDGVLMHLMRLVAANTLAKIDMNIHFSEHLSEESFEKYSAFLYLSEKAKKLINFDIEYYIVCIYNL